MSSGKDDIAFKIGSAGVVISDTALSQFPEHMGAAYKTGLLQDLAKLRPVAKIGKEKSPVTIRSILRGLEDKKLGKNFRESIEYLCRVPISFDT